MERVFRADDGVSPVLGVILLVAVTVILSTTIGVFVFDLHESLSSPPPDAEYSPEIDSADQTITLQSVTGEVETSRLRIHVDGDGRSAEIHPDGSIVGDLAVSSVSGALVSSDEWGAGDRTQFTIGEDVDDVRVTVVDEESSQAVGRYTLDSSGLNFDKWAQSATVSVDNPNSVALEDYQVKVTVDRRDGMADDYSDLRFTQSVDGSDRQLAYWIEEATADQAVVWVKVPEIPSDGTELTMYYDNSAASLVSSPQGTFRANEIYYENRECTDATYCDPTDNHDEFDTVMTFSLHGTTYVEKIDFHNDHPVNEGSDFSTRYRFLYVPSEDGTYTFRTDSDDASELIYNTYDTDDHDVITSWYTNHSDSGSTCGGSHDGDRDLTAGDGYWMEYRMVERGGSADSQLCIQQPSSGSMEVFNSDNFAGEFFARKYADSEPTATVNG